MKTLQVPITSVRDNPYNTRENYGDLEGLKVSIANHGILQPLIVRRLDSSDEYEIVFGSRRLRCLRELGKTNIEVELRDIKDADMAILALCENVHRKDLTTIELAKAYQRGLTATKLSVNAFSQIIGDSHKKITNYITLLELPSRILENEQNYNVTELIAMAAMQNLSTYVRTDLENVINERQIPYKFLLEIVSSCEGIYASTLPERTKKRLCNEIIWHDYSKLPPQNYKDIKTFSDEILKKELIEYNERVQKTVNALKKAREAKRSGSIKNVYDVVDANREVNKLTDRLYETNLHIQRAVKKDFYSQASRRSKHKLKTSINKVVSSLEEIIRSDKKVGE